MGDEIDPWGPPGGNEGRGMASERKEDLEMRYAYFIVNNGGLDREIIVNKTENSSPTRRLGWATAGIRVYRNSQQHGIWHGIHGPIWGYEFLPKCRPGDDDGGNDGPDQQSRTLVYKRLTKNQTRPGTA